MRLSKVIKYFVQISKVSLSLHKSSSSHAHHHHHKIKKSKKASTDPKREREEQTEKETIKAPKENSNAPKAGNPELGQYIVWCKHLGFSHNFEDVIQKFVSQKCGIYFKKKLKYLIVNFEIIRLRRQY